MGKAPARQVAAAPETACQVHYTPCTVHKDVAHLHATDQKEKTLAERSACMARADAARVSICQVASGLLLIEAHAYMAAPSPCTHRPAVQTPGGPQLPRQPSSQCRRAGGRPGCRPLLCSPCSGPWLARTATAQVQRGAFGSSCSLGCGANEAAAAAADDAHAHMANMLLQRTWTRPVPFTTSYSQPSSTCLDCHGAELWQFNQRSNQQLQAYLGCGVGQLSCPPVASQLGLLKPSHKRLPPHQGFEVGVAGLGPHIASRPARIGGLFRLVAQVHAAGKYWLLNHCLLPVQAHPWHTHMLCLAACSQPHSPLPLSREGAHLCGGTHIRTAASPTAVPPCNSNSAAATKEQLT